MLILRLCGGLVILVLLITVALPTILYIQKDHPAFKGLIPTLTPPDSWNYHFKDIPNLSGKIAIVTGANVGLGFYNAKYLAMNGATTVLACRNMQKCKNATATIKTVCPESMVTAMHCDLSSLNSVKQFIENFRQEHAQLDILVLNAGVMHTPYTLSTDGFELQFAVNHLGHHYLATRLLPMLQKSTFSTVVSVSSSGQWHNYGAIELTVERINDKGKYDPVLAYGQSKLYNVLFAQEFAERVSKQQIYVNVIHPGGVVTSLGRHWIESSINLFGELITRTIESAISSVMWKPDIASLTQLYAATSPEIEKKNIRGKYFVPIAQLGETAKEAKNETFQKELWEFSERLISIVVEKEKSNKFITG